MVRPFALLLAVCFVSPVTADDLNSLPADCPTVVRAWFTDRAMVDELASWTEPWEVHHDRGYVVLGVDFDGFERLADAGFVIEIDEKRTFDMCRPFEALKDQVSGIPGFPCYRTVEETFAAAEALVAARPDLATFVDVGDSWEKTEPGGLDGYDMKILKLTNSNVAGTPAGDPPMGKPKLLVTSAIHARELTTAELMIRFAEHLVNNYGLDADATWLLDEHEIHLMLHTNPDGRKNAETGIWWRKNTNNNYCSDTDSRGADLNRNFEFEWNCCGGSSSDECFETYHGASPASEPEVQAVQAYARSIFPDQREDDLGAAAPDDATGIYIDVHSYSELVLWPWGFGSAMAPNGTGLQTLGRKLAFFNGYYPEQAVGLYPTDGTTDDFTYGDLGVASLSFELGTSFFQDCGSFESTIYPDNFQSLLYAAKVVRTPYITPAGPEVTEIDLGGVPIVAPGDPLDVAATLDDTRFNNQNGSEPTQSIAQAELYLDLPPWDAGAPAAITMTPADGSFDSPVEDAITNLDTTGLAEGRHSLFILAADSDGNWGPVGAAFFWVLDLATVPHLAGTVTSTGDGSPLEATITAAVFSTTSSAADGSYDVMVAPGTYDVTVEADGHATASASGVVAVTGTTTVQDFALIPYTVVFEDDVENGNAGWTADSPWAITTETAASPTHSWSDSPGGNYTSGVETSLISPLWDLTGISDVNLTFNHVYATDSGWDYCFVEYSTDGGNIWTPVATYDGTQSQWQEVELDLGALDGAAAARIRFRLAAVAYGNANDGWHLDDIVLRGAIPLPAQMFVDGFESGDVTAWSATVP